jgi:hypothetical protein
MNSYLQFDSIPIYLPYGLEYPSSLGMRYPEKVLPTNKYNNFLIFSKKDLNLYFDLLNKQQDKNNQLASYLFVKYNNYLHISLKESIYLSFLHTYNIKPFVYVKSLVYFDGFNPSLSLLKAFAYLSTTLKLFLNLYKLVLAFLPENKLKLSKYFSFTFFNFNKFKRIYSDFFKYFKRSYNKYTTNTSKYTSAHSSFINDLLQEFEPSILFDITVENTSDYS